MVIVKVIDNLSTASYWFSSRSPH